MKLKSELILSIRHLLLFTMESPAKSFYKMSGSQRHAIETDNELSQCLQEYQTSILKGNAIVKKSGRMIMQKTVEWRKQNIKLASKTDLIKTELLIEIIVSR